MCASRRAGRLAAVKVSRAHIFPASGLSAGLRFSFVTGGRLGGMVRARAPLVGDKGKGKNGTKKDANGSLTASGRPANARRASTKRHAHLTLRSARKKRLLITSRTEARDRPTIETGACRPTAMRLWCTRESDDMIGERGRGCARESQSRRLQADWSDPTGNPGWIRPKQTSATSSTLSLWAGSHRDKPDKEGGGGPWHSLCQLCAHHAQSSPGWRHWCRRATCRLDWWRGRC